MKLMSWALLLGAAAGTQMTATAQTTQATPWDNQTYEWTDAEGITHTAKLTDKATDPRQIMALLGAVYTDPTVPGQNQHNEYLADGTPCIYQLYERNINYDDHGRWTYHYNIGPVQGRGATDVSEAVLLQDPSLYFKPNGFEWESDEQKQEVNLYFATHKDYDLFDASRGWAYMDWIGDRTEPIPNPVEGMTVLLVEVKDTWTQDFYSRELERSESTLPHIEKAFKSAQLMTQWLRVNDETNPGYIFLADEVTTNRFFFLSKGRTRRQNTRRAPIGVAYEIVSPRNTQLQAENLNNGDVERVQHDCNTVFQMGKAPHYVELDDNEASALSKLTLFMPDKRFRGVRYDPVTNTVDNEGWTEWYTSQYPEYLYQDPVSDDDEYRNRFKPGMLLYKAFLNAEAVPSQTNGYYDIKLDWRTWFDAEKLYTNVGEQYYVYILKNDGSWQLLKEVDAAASAGMDETTTQKTFTYPWPQTDQVQTFTYMITANPIDGETVSNIFVNSNTATVIIPGTTELFINASDYRSRFAYDTEQKELNVYRNRPVLMLNSAHVHTNKNYSLHRIAIGENGAETDTEVASLQFTEQDKHNHIYGYTITYMNQNLDPIFDDQTTKDMTVTGSGFTIGQGITLVDRFTASTADNSHPGGYAYVVRFKDDGATKSNRYNVPVFKSKNVAHFAGFTRAQVDGDIGHQLVEENEVWVDFTVTEDLERTIERYDVHRVNEVEELPKGYHARIGKAECTNDNNLAMIGINHESGSLTVDLGSYPIHKVVGQNLRFYDDSDYCPFDEPQYVTEVFVGTRDWQGSHTINTYGTNISQVGVPQLAFELVGKPVKSNPFPGKNGPVMGYAAKLQLTPDLTKANEIKNVYYYRIWRLEDDGTETLLNELENQNEDQAGNFEYNFVASYSGIQRNWLSSTDHVTVIDNYISGILPADVIETDPDTGETVEVKGRKDVTYIARMYSTTESEQTAQPSARRIYPQEGNVYYVTEKRLTVTYDHSDNVITAVDRVMMPSQVVSTRYYNLMGVSSDTPHQGVNIVVTVHADGTVTSHKAIF